MGLTMTVPRSELKEAVSGFSKIVTGKSTLPVLGCVRFENNGKGVVGHVNPDLDQTARYHFAEAQAQGEGAFIVPLASLKDLAKGKQDEQVEFEAGAGTGVTATNHIGAQTVRLPLSGMDIDEWPVCPPEVATKPADGFLATYRRLVPFASTDETRYVLNSVYIEAGKGDNPVTMVATDGRRLSLWNTMNLPLESSVIIPTTRFLSWTGLKGDTAIGLRTEKVKKETRILGLAVNAGPWFYDIKTIEANFPNYRQVIPAEEGAHRIVFADDDVDVLRKVLPAFPGADEITVVGDSGKVTFYGRGPDDEQWTTLKLDGSQYEGKRAFVGLNRHYLLDALAAGFRSMAITDELCPVVSRDANGGMHVLMPLRVTDPQDTGEQTKEQAGAEPVQTEPAAAPAPQTPEPAGESRITQPKRRRSNMADKNGIAEPTALDSVLAACETAKGKVTEAGSALADLARAIKDAAKENKTQAADLHKARATLQKLQAISL